MLFSAQLYFQSAVGHPQMQRADSGQTQILKHTRGRSPEPLVVRGSAVLASQQAGLVGRLLRAALPVLVLSASIGSLASSVEISDCVRELSFSLLSSSKFLFALCIWKLGC